MLVLGALGGCGTAADSRDSTEGGGAEALVFPSGPAPKKVVVRDLKVGHGAPLKRGDYISVNYVAYDYDTREVLEKHWGPAETFGGTWGRDAGFIKAWEIGLRGMKEGGERELITPGKFVHGGSARVYLMKMVKIIRVQDLVEKITEDSPAGGKPPNWTPIERVAGKESDRLLIPQGPPPEKVVVRDLRIGDGPILKPGDTFSTKYLV
ncbi:MAG TPA: FKBP-type peptidyl-prolyl cis-trans isomerase, partial [Solirubrobacterales bacterium]|nr:FKBP-type peptidyl-prolyl cis-trans isomerase [Solirubrobacterales bacterium]